MRSTRARRLLGALGLLVVGTAVEHSVGLWLNLSPSMPIGLYRSRSSGEARALMRGAIVAVCLPESLAAWGRRRGYLMRGRCPGGTTPVGKPIFAVAGDTVTVAAAGLVRNRVLANNTLRLAQDHAGFPLPRIPCGTYPVSTGQLWLVSTNTPLSWDSRYFGPVATANVVAVLRPLWVQHAR
jgi:conjugative transfer signal peptidase TraF